MNDSRSIWLPVLLLTLFLAACSPLKQPGERIDYYALEYPPLRLGDLKPLPATIRMERFTVAPMYNTTQIIYRDQSFKREAYAYYRWRANPGDLVTYFLGRDLRESGVFRAVAPQGSRMGSQYVLEGSVDDFFEWDAEDAWKAVLTVSITLLVDNEPDISKRIIFQRIFGSSKPCKQRNPMGLAEAMSEAMAEVSQEIIKNIYQSLKDRP